MNETGPPDSTPQILLLLTVRLESLGLPLSDGPTPVRPTCNNGFPVKKKKQNKKYAQRMDNLTSKFLRYRGFIGLTAVKLF